jgi:hypothetical protein
MGLWDLYSPGSLPAPAVKIMTQETVETSQVTFKSLVTRQFIYLFLLIHTFIYLGFASFIM